MQLSLEGAIRKVWDFRSRELKGQLIPKADLRAIDSPKKRTDEFVLFAFLLFTSKKKNHSFGFFWRIYGA